MSRILVLGAGGMLGHKVCQNLRHHDVLAVVRRDASRYAAYPELFGGTELVGGVDVLDEARLAEVVRESAPTTVVNCVGLVKQLEQAEDPYLAVAINALLPHRLARLCRETGAQLIHISTDCVFDGQRGAYRESDLTNARDLYGRSKALGETTDREPSGLTLRTSFIGRELKSAKHGLVEWFLAQAGGRVNGFANVIYSGLTSLELARVITRIIDAHPSLRGLYHVASEPISKLDLLELIRSTYGLDVEIKRAEQPVCDRSLVMSGFAKDTGYAATSWPRMIREMYDDPTPYDIWTAHRENDL